MSACTQFRHLFFGRPLSRRLYELLLNTWLTAILLSILLTRPIHFNRPILTNEIIFKFPKSWINYVLFGFLRFSFSLIPPKNSS